MRFQLIRVESLGAHPLRAVISREPWVANTEVPLRGRSTVTTIVAPIRAFTNYLNKVGEHQEEAKSKFGHRKALFGDKVRLNPQVLNEFLQSK